MHSQIAIHKFQIKRIKIDLKIPIVVFGNKLNVRELLILNINDSETEIAPLPGIHTFNIDQEESALRYYLKNNKTINLEKLSEIKSHVLSFALRCLFYPALNNSSYFRSHTFISDLTNIPHTLSPYCLKIKISPEIIEKNWNKLEYLLQEIPTRKFRLDSNQSFNQVTLLKLDEKIRPYLRQIDYLEEPLKNMSEWNILSFPYPLALDESLKGFDFLKRPHNLSNLIMRPSIQTQVENETLISNAIKYNLKIVIGSCYEGRIGIENILKYISIYQNVFSFDQGIDFLLN
jgi:O-succinylbenzoate synthase